METAPPIMIDVVESAAAVEVEVAPPLPAVRSREALCLLVFVILADVTIFRGRGYTGLAVACAGFPLLMRWGAAVRNVVWSQWLVLVLLWGIAGRLVWCGNPLAVLCAIWLLPAMSMSVAGLVPDSLGVIRFAMQALSGLRCSLLAYDRYLRTLFQLQRFSGNSRTALSILVPTLAVLVFGTIFIFANPDLLQWVNVELSNMLRQLLTWLGEFSPSAAEVVFVLLALVWGVALLRPGIRPSHPQHAAATARPATEAIQSPEHSVWYEPARNTLIAVVVLFAGYLVFEFVTLWGRVFPKGFHYSGYAHEGAAWLTIALGLGTVTLSLIFQGAMLRDPRLKTLRRWGAIWTVQNLILAVAVCHRLQIYIGFNGMTRMRVVGLLGIAAVVAGLCLVIWKIARNRSFGWLVQRQLWVLGFAVYLYAVLPVDYWITRYNVQRILAGDSSPSVQISVHRLSDEGWLLLPELLEAPDPEVRNGIKALLSRMQAAQLQNRNWRLSQGWTRSQIAEQHLERMLSEIPPEQLRFANDDERDEAINAFAEYAYQWF